MSSFSCKTLARPRPAAAWRLGISPSTGHVLLAWRKKDKAHSHHLFFTPTSAPPSLFFHVLFPPLSCLSVCGRCVWAHFAEHLLMSPSQIHIDRGVTETSVGHNSAQSGSQQVQIKINPEILQCAGLTHTTATQTCKCSMLTTKVVISMCWRCLDSLSVGIISASFRISQRERKPGARRQINPWIEGNQNIGYGLKNISTPLQAKHTIKCKNDLTLPL